jgi:hypothetical protein
LSEYLGFALTYHSAKNLFEQKLRDRVPWSWHSKSVDCTSQWNVCCFIITINHRYNPHKHEVIGVMFTNWFHYGARPYCLKNDGQPRDIRGTMGYRYCRMGFTESRVPLKIHWLITILL